jgi:feruloyl-CoA synthase
MVSEAGTGLANAARFAPREVDVRYCADGTILLRSPMALDGCERHICAYLERWADLAPDRTFLAQRGTDGDWQRLSYGDAWRRAQAIGQALLDHGLAADAPLAILTGNSIEHALMAFGAMTAGVPVAPISPSYSMSSEGLARLADIADMLRPRMVFAQSADSLGLARTLPQLAEIPWISVEPASAAVTLGAFETVGHVRDVKRAFAAADQASVGKILFTSGSTGKPKGVPNTQAMLCSAVRAAGLAFPVDYPPVTVDWMPWHHTLGGNSTLHGILRDGGTMYIDDGRPLPGAFERTVRNLTEIATTFVQNVPAGFQMLVSALETDTALTTRFFEQLERMAFAGASLTPDTFNRMQQLAVQATGAPVPFIAGYGTTETGPGISSTHWASEGKGEIGLPFAGCEIKLVPFGDRFDLRARGPNVFPGYLGRPDLTAEAFDEEGFYKVGDAAQFVDPTDPSQGLRFAGRLSENFKLSNGTWVLTGELRLAVIAAVPSIAEAVVAGHDRDDIRLLVWAKGDAADLAETLRAGFEAYNANNKSSTRRIAAFLVVTDPPSMAAGEITDKGYVNQRAVLTNRNWLVEDLYSQAQSVIMCRS